MFGFFKRSVPKFEIGRLDLQPGDIIVLKHKDPISSSQVERIKTDIALSTGGHRCMVLAGGLDIAVLSAPKGDDEVAA